VTVFVYLFDDKEHETTWIPRATPAFRMEIDETAANNGYAWLPLHQLAISNRASSMLLDDFLDILITRQYDELNQNIGILEDEQLQRRAMMTSPVKEFPAQFFPLRWPLLCSKIAMEKTVYFIRHGQSEANALSIEIPDPLLTERGVAQASGLAAWSSQLNVQAVVVSPLRRALQTATLAFHGAYPLIYTYMYIYPYKYSLTHIHICAVG
jgi:hypothetical protein